MERSKQTKMRYDKNYITHKTSGLWTNNINKFKSVTINTQMIQWKGSDCKYVEIFTHRVGSIAEGQCLLEGQAPNNNNVIIIYYIFK
jgi:hypothetical protein